MFATMKEQLKEAERFAKEIKVDCLAVSIGNAHGPHKGTPSWFSIAFER